MFETEPARNIEGAQPVVEIASQAKHRAACTNFQCKKVVTLQPSCSGFTPLSQRNKNNETATVLEKGKVDLGKELLNQVKASRVGDFPCPEVQ